MDLLTVQREMIYYKQVLMETSRLVAGKETTR